MASRATTLVPKGALFLGVLVEGDPPNEPATRANLEAWITSAKAPYTWALDATAPQTDFKTYFSVPRDTAILINLSTMKIISIGDLGSALTELTALLDQ
jgi:hypothetical protein